MRLSDPIEDIDIDLPGGLLLVELVKGGRDG